MVGVIGWILMVLGGLVMFLDNRRLRAAIRKHRDARGHERCWLNDLDLYAAIGPAPPGWRLPPREEFLERCAEYYEQQRGGEAR